MPPEPLPVRDAARNIVDYHDGLTQITANIGDIRDRAGDVVDDLSLVRRALDKIDGIKGQVSGLGDDIDKLQLVVKLMGKAGPLKPIAKTADTMLKNVENAVERVERQIDAVARRVTDSQINQKLETAIGAIEDADDTLAQAQSKVIGQRDSFKGVADIAAKAYVFAEEPIVALGSVMDAPAAAVTEINRVYAQITGDIDGFNARMPSGDFKQLLTIEAEFDRIFGVLDGIRGPLDIVYGALKPIEPLLNVVGLVTKFTVDPVIDFLLNTLGIQDVIDAASDRITQFLPDVDVLDRMLDNIDLALPELDGIVGNFGDYDDDGDEAVDAEGRPEGEDTPVPQADGTFRLPTPRIDDPFGIGQWAVDEIEARLIQTATEVRNDATDEVLGFVRERIGTLDAQGLAVFIEIPQPLRGSTDDPTLSADVGGVPIANVILAGDDRDNLITAFAGSNLLYGAGGDDTLVGGGNDTAPGTGGAAPVLSDPDTAAFTGPLEQYTFTWADLDNAYSDLTVEHVSPLQGVSFDGTDLLQGIERVSFLGTTVVTADGEEQALTLTMQALRDRVTTTATDFTAPAGQTNPDGSPADFFIIAQYARPFNQPGVSITGAEGGDLLVGGARNDTLNGGAGDDTFKASFGDDSIVGGPGRDLFVLDPGDAFTASIDLAAGTVEVEPFGSEPTPSATLSGIEDASASAARGVYLYGDDAAAGNVLSGKTATDALHGRGGDDTLQGGGGVDTLVGGTGRDTLQGGDGRDHLIATDDATAWAASTDPDTGQPRGERLFGGAGEDTAYYTTRLDTDGPSYRGNLGPTWRAPFDDFRWGGGASDREKMQQFIETTGWIETVWRVPTATQPGRVEVHRMADRAADGSAAQLAVDVLESVERIVGTEQDDVLRGLPDAAGLTGLFGADGNDTLHAEGASGLISGDAGVDLVYASARLLPQVSGDEDLPRLPTRRFAGDEFDTLDLSLFEGVRWSLWREEPGRRDVVSNTFLRANDARDGQVLDGGAGQSNYARDAIVGFGAIILGDGDDVVSFDLSENPSRGQQGVDQIIRGGDGKDQISVFGQVGGVGDATTVFGEDGDDQLKMTFNGLLDGGAGNDDIFGRTGQVTLQGGEGDDTISFLEVIGSVADGGAGVDVLQFPAGNEALVIDFAAGTARSIDSNLQVANFEAAAGGFGDDTLRGGASDDQFVGGSGNDMLWGGDQDAFVGSSSAELEIPNRGLLLSVDGPHADALRGSFTVEATLTTLSDDASFQRIVTGVHGTANQRFSLALKDGQAHFRGDMVTGGPVSVQGGTLADGAEHNVLGQYDAATRTLSLWLDGVLIGTTTAAAPLRPLDGAITVGAFNGDIHQYIDAEIAGVRIWDAVVDPDAASVPAPYLALRDDSDRADLLAPGAEIAQSGTLATPVAVEGVTTGQDALYGGAGADSLNGGDGDDLLSPGGSGGGIDTVVGGRGSDTVSFAFAGLDADLRAEVDVDAGAEGLAPVFVALSDGVQYSMPPGRGGEVRTRLESVENVIGTHLDDLIVGDAGANVLTGGEGADTINGLAGDDVIAALGADTINAGAGDDTIGVNRADAQIRGGAGRDEVAFDGDDTAEGPGDAVIRLNAFTYDLQAGTYSGTVSYDRPVWREAYADEGTDDDAPRAAPGQPGGTLTPLLVWRSQPEEVRSVADLDRVVPVHDPDADPADGAVNPTDFRIAFVRDTVAVTGTLDSIEAVRGAGGAGSAGAEALTGTIFADRIDGRGGSDTLDGLDGADELLGGDGDDLIRGGTGFDTIGAGAGADTVLGGDGPDLVTLAAGDDVFFDTGQGGVLGRDTVFTGLGDDTVQGGNGDDAFYGQAGNDLIFARLGNDLVYGGPGFDSLYAGDGADTVHGGDGRDLVFLGTGADVFFDTGQGGELGRDTVFTGQGDDTVQGGNGNDAFYGGAGDDVIFARLGDDLIFGGPGFDSLYAGAGADTVHGGDGRDLVFLGTGADVFFDTGQGGEAGRDTVFAGSGGDVIQGGNGGDAFHGEDGADLILARLGDDSVYGGAGADTIDAGAGDDLVFGGFGPDRVSLGDGNDRYVDTDQAGPLGQDTIAGGAGADTFVFGATPSADVILGFQSGIDTLELSAALTDGRSPLQIAIGARPTPEGLLLDFGAGDSILLAGVGFAPGLAGDITIV